ncbi:MAG: putative 2OG-Fe(II) oxygenase [Rhizomicrobium sp.]
MHWLTTETSRSLPTGITISLLHKAIAVRPDDAALFASLGEAYVATGDFRAAAQAFEQAVAREARDRTAWILLAQCYLELGEGQAALDVCMRSDAVPATAEIAFHRGQALSLLGRSEEARQAFLSVLELGDRRLNAMHALLAPLAPDPDPTTLLAFCDGLARRYQDTAIVRAHRAIAFSRLGRTSEASKLVDLDRHVVAMSFDPPAAFGGLANFNRLLAEEILADVRPARAQRDGLEIDYAPQTRSQPAMTALLAFIRDAMDSYIRQLSALGLDAVMPPPEAGTLFSANVVLRRDGANGEHIHRAGYISSVYYVRVPRIVSEANDERGSLVLGKCERYTGGYRPCWGTRFIKPVEGRLILFPSHLFHDVVPTGLEEPRISVAADLIPASEAQAQSAAGR